MYGNIFFLKFVLLLYPNSATCSSTTLNETFATEDKPYYNKQRFLTKPVFSVRYNVINEFF